MTDMRVVEATPDWVELECEACQGHQRLANFVYVLCMTQARVLACPACRRVSRAPERRRRPLAVAFDRRSAAGGRPA